MRIVAVMMALLLTACSILPTSLEDLGAWRSKADAAYKEQDYATAAEYYKKMTVAVPSDSENWFRLGNCYARMQDTSAAITAYRESLVRDRLFAKAWYNVGFNQLREAQRTFSDALDNIPTDSPMYPIMRSYNEKLLALIDEQNNAVDAINNNKRNMHVDPKSVEIITLDEKAAPTVIPRVTPKNPAGKTNVSPAP